MFLNNVPISAGECYKKGKVGFNNNYL